MNAIQRVLAISPHLDDAVLSAGATLADFTTHGSYVEVFTLFAGIPQDPLSSVAGAFHAKCGLPEVATAVAIRIDEDRAAIETLGAHPRHCDFLDAIYRRTPSNDKPRQSDQAPIDDLPIDEIDVLAEVSSEIRRILADVDPDLVLTCGAVGNHIDHRLTKAAVLDAVENTKASTLLWEDLPYAIGHPSPAALAQIRTVPCKAWQLKCQAITCYATQIRMLWPDNINWCAELLAHAKIRGNGRPAELLIPHTP